MKGTKGNSFYGMAIAGGLWILWGVRMWTSTCGMVWMKFYIIKCQLTKECKVFEPALYSEVSEFGGYLAGIWWVSLQTLE